MRPLEGCSRELLDEIAIAVDSARGEGEASEKLILIVANEYLARHIEKIPQAYDREDVWPERWAH